MNEKNEFAFVMYAYEVVRPWKVFTLLTGILLLFWGADYYQSPDWDNHISTIMALLTYYTAPVATAEFFRAYDDRRAPKWWSWAMYIGTVDISYWLYNSLMDHEHSRLYNFPASTALYFACGILWMYRGSISELFNDTKTLAYALISRTK
jgi:hypothetical protein